MWWNYFKIISFQSVTVVFLKREHAAYIDASCPANIEGQTPSDSRISVLLPWDFGQRN